MGISGHVAENALEVAEPRLTGGGVGWVGSDARGSVCACAGHGVGIRFGNVGCLCGGLGAQW